MANITNTPSAKWVIDQIKARQNALGTFDRTIVNHDLLKYFNSKTSFMRLASSVNITPNSKADNDIKKLGIDTSNLLEDGLAKKLILFSGVSEYPNGKKLSGIDNSGIPNMDNAYGFLSTANGAIPMPGIESAKVSYYNRGTLQKASIKIKCYSREQFALIDYLYLRPGYSILLEYGHTLYLDNNKELQEFKFFKGYPLTELFSPDTNHYKMYDRIKQERENRLGNYNAFFGKVVKYNWSFSADGSYEITVEATGMGDVIEALKVNIQPDIVLPNANVGRDLIDLSKVKPLPIDSERVETYSLVAEAKNDLREFIDNGREYSNVQFLFELTKSSFNGKPIPTADEYEKILTDRILDAKKTAALNLAIYDAEQINAKIQENLDFEKQVKEENEERKTEPSLSADSNRSTLNHILYNIYNGFKGKGSGTHKLQYKVRNTDGKVVFIDDKKGVYVADNETLNSISATDGSDEIKTPHTYIKLGILLSYLEMYAIPTDKKDIQLLKFDINYFDLNKDLNYCTTFPTRVSIDPRVCVIPYNTNTDIESYYYKGKKLNIKEFEVDSIPIPITNTYTGIGGAGSTSLLNNSTVELPTKEPIAEFDSSFIIPNEPYLGRMMNIYVNISHVTGLMRSIANSQNDNYDVNLVDLLQQLMDSISKAMGSINKFKITTDKNYIKIIEEAPIVPQTLERDTAIEYALFNLYGVRNNEGSFVYSFNMSSEISPSFASQITIGAQANGNTSNVNATSFSNFNEGLIDRIIKEKVTNNTVNVNEGVETGVSQGDKVNALEKIKKLSSEVYEVLSKGFANLDNSGIDNLQSKYSEFCSLVVGELTKNPTSTKDSDNNIQTMKSPFFIPVKLSITMDGLSGLLLYEKINFYNNILPPSYGEDNVEFIITALTDDITNDNSWKTTLETTCTGKTNYKDINQSIDSIASSNLAKSDSTFYQSPSSTVKPKKLNSTILQKLKGKVPDKVYRELDTVINKFKIDTDLKMAHFLGQCAHESGVFNKTSENLNYSKNALKATFGKYFPTEALLNAYANKPEKIANRVYAKAELGNGNENSGDGYKYRGRGYIQLTGKYNYEKFAKFIGEDTVSNPDLVATKYPLSSAAYFFSSKNISNIANRGIDDTTISKVSTMINAKNPALNLSDRTQKTLYYYNILNS